MWRRCPRAGLHSVSPGPWGDFGVGVWPHQASVSSLWKLLQAWEPIYFPRDNT